MVDTRTQHPGRDRRPPDDQVTVTLSVTARLVADGDLAVWLGDVLVYTTGVAFSLEGRIRHPGGRPPPSSKGLNLGNTKRPTSAVPVRLSVELADGTTLFNSTPRQQFPEDPAAYWLDGAHGASSFVESSGHYFLSPLPPAGAVRVTIDYPEFGIAQTSVDLDGAAIRAASPRAVKLWSNNEQ